MVNMYLTLPRKAGKQGARGLMVRVASKRTAHKYQSHNAKRTARDQRATPGDEAVLNICL